MLLKAKALKRAKVSKMGMVKIHWSKMSKTFQSKKMLVLLIKKFLLKKSKKLEKHLPWLAVANLTKNVGNVNECIYCHIVN